MDAIYDRECFPSLDQAIDWVWASSEDEISAVNFVLTKFFVLENGVYIQSRMQQTIQEYQGQRETNAINGKKGGRPKNKPKITQPVNLKTQSVNLKSGSEPGRNPTESLNHKPLTINHKPITNTNTSEPIGSDKTKKKYGERDYKVAEYFYQTILADLPGFKTPNLESWANSVRLMRERDSRTYEDIKLVWDWARKDNFWKPNILSASKFRDKFDQLKAKMATGEKSAGYNNVTPKSAIERRMLARSEGRTY